MTGYKRRLIPIVDRRFQLKYTGLIFFVAATVSTALGYFLLDAYQQLNALIEVSEAIGDRMNADDARRVFTLVAGFLGAEVLLLGVAGVIITHRVAGPVALLHRHFATMLDGKYPQLRSLRAGDEFRDAFEAFGRFVNSLRERDVDELATLEAVLADAQRQGLSEAHIASLKAMAENRRQRTASS
ncbi:MAG: hypothetical protein ACO3JL_16775 [Myxococcota bacterium]